MAMSIRLSVRMSHKMRAQKRGFLKSNLELWLLTTNRKSYMGFSKNPYLDR